MDVIESNEAFAAQALAVTKGLNLDMDKTNPNGAIALAIRSIAQVHLSPQKRFTSFSGSMVVTR